MKRKALILFIIADGAIKINPQPLKMRIFGREERRWRLMGKKAVKM